MNVPQVAAGSAGLPALDPKRLSLLWAVAGHGARIAQLHGAIFEKPWSEREIGDLLMHPGSVALVATQGAPTDLGGFVLAQIAADEAEVLTLGVVEGWRRHGVGLKLIEAVKRAAAKAGAKVVFLEVAESNAAARQLYARAGFTETARRAKYYARAHGPAEDAIVLRAELKAP